MYKGANMTTQIRVDYITRIAIQMTKKQNLQYCIVLYCIVTVFKGLLI